MKHLNILENNTGCLFYMHEKKYGIHLLEAWDILYMDYYDREPYKNTQEIKSPLLFLESKKDMSWDCGGGANELYKIKYLYEDRIGVSWLSHRETKNCLVVFQP